MCGLCVSFVYKVAHAARGDAQQLRAVAHAVHIRDRVPGPPAAARLEQRLSARKYTSSQLRLRPHVVVFVVVVVAIVVYLMSWMLFVANANVVVVVL